MLRQARAGGLSSAQQPAAQPLRQAATTEDAFEGGDQCSGRALLRKSLGDPPAADAQPPSEVAVVPKAT